MAFRITSPAFADGADIPRRHTCDGEGVSPALTWSGAPGGTRSFVLIMDDPDAPRGTFTHWVLCDIPPETTQLGEMPADGAAYVAGRNSYGRTGYGSPCPPPGDSSHRYRFTVHALAIPKLGVSAGVTREDVEARFEAHVLGVAQLVGKYQRARARTG